EERGMARDIVGFERRRLVAALETDPQILGRGVEIRDVTPGKQDVGAALGGLASERTRDRRGRAKDDPAFGGRGEGRLGDHRAGPNPSRRAWSEVKRPCGSTRCRTASKRGSSGYMARNESGVSRASLAR